MSKIVNFIQLSRDVGFRVATRYSLDWVKFRTRRAKPKKPRLQIERDWMVQLADRDNITGAEIGVQHGRHAGFLIDALDIEKLYLIDPYEAYEEYTESWSTEEEMTLIKNMAQERLSGFDSTIFIQKYSNDAISDISENLDFVYIDGNHDYEFVKDDIANYYPLVREGGILAGHDYTPGNPGVIQAVNEFAHQHGLQVRRDIHSDWFFIKPGTE